MKTKLEQIYQKKKKTISLLNKLNNKYLQVIYKGLVEEKSLREIHKDIRKVSVWQRNERLPIDARQEKYAERLARKAKKEVDMQSVALPSEISLVVYEVFRETGACQEMKSFSYEYARKEEELAKETLINKALNSNGRDLKDREDAENAKIFFLASSHDDCAKDHLNAQGKMYIDEDWQRVVRNDEVREEIRIYVKRNNIKTFQWVINKPTWFITRPNCRHFFEQLPVKEVLSYDVDTLIDKYKMHSKIGNRRQQTLYHSTDRTWYTRENIENIIGKYEERLEYHNSLYEIQKNDELRKEIMKDKLLIKKWKSYLQNKNG